MCGFDYSLPDGLPAECDPDGEKPLCMGGECITDSSNRLCFGSDCVDYRLVRAVRESGENCTITKLNTGYLKNVCYDENARVSYFKCPHSDDFYKYVNVENGHGGADVGFCDVCENDPHTYQTCGIVGHSQKGKSNVHALCGGYICEKEKLGKKHKYISCVGDKCQAENRDCSSSTVFKTCDDKCDDYRVECRDELSCNGYSYKLNCISTRDFVEKDYFSGTEVLLYGKQDSICGDESEMICNEESDEYNCSVNTCTHYRKKWKARILNYTRCALFDLSPSNFVTYPYCEEYLDQTNCSDAERIGGYCEVNGFWSSVSKYMVCYEQDPISKAAIKLCDDDFQNNCLTTSHNSGCKIHKHRMCDDVNDCFDGSDEINDMCATKINFTCVRRFNPGKAANTIPISWIMDNEADCMNGEDENSTMWNFCKGTGNIRRLQVPDKDCENVYRCPGANNSVVPFDQLCDGVESCGGGKENDVCRIARDYPDIKKTVAYIGRQQDVCFNENKSLCEVKEFERPWGDVFGEPKKELLVPSSKVNCSSFFGESYLFLSCMGLCEEENAECSLKADNRKLMFDSCPGQYPDRAYTLGNNSFLTFVDKSQLGQYHQDFYQCNNRKCVKYSQVCDLVDDCGDMSDELGCANNMICQNTLNSSRHQFISLSQKCDGIYDCFDLSDECNESCRRYILENWAVKGFCWIMGILAVTLNLFAVTRSLNSARKCATDAMMTSKILMSLIGSGDFLIGLYLVILSIYDSIIYGDDYCSSQATWLTGTACLALGIISTIGSQVSLFSMTVMSCIRLHGLRSMRISGPVNKKAVGKVTLLVMGIVASSLVVALTPLVPPLEDYFVQGMYYDPSYKLFIGFPTKERHINILNSYKEHNPTKSTGNFTSDLSWREIGEKVDEMFSQDHGTLTRRPVHFYGNDGVCLFKYFVRTDDARRSRQSSGIETSMNDPVVWTMLAVNLICFFVISLCYIAINAMTRKSVEQSGQQDNAARMKEVNAVQKKVMFIIATDFLCWVPFIIISGLHNLQYINASTWYSSFAMIVLPFNSVINPLVYDGDMKELIKRRFGSIKKGATTAISSISIRMRRKSDESISMDPVNETAM